MLIKGGAVTPATTATLTPEPNANGWNNANVTVALNAVDMPGGTGIATVSYSATGAQPIALTPVTGASASIAINVEGQTTIAYYATNNSGVTEAAHNVTVSLDKTLPAIAYAGNQGTYGVLDTVNITCTASDSLSGLLLNTCADISGPAWQFSLTGNTLLRDRDGLRQQCEDGDGELQHRRHVCGSVHPDAAVPGHLKP